MLLLTTVISFIAGIFIYIFFIFFSIGIDFPFFKLVDFSLIRIFRNLLIILVVPALGFIGFYFYPYTERESIGRKIERELPFVTIHMSAIAGSGIEPSQIFKIIATGKEYPATRQELRKVINQVNVYGYDLVNSLRNSARATPSSKMAELFNGFATTISSGGSLPEFLDKRSETLLFDYRLDREKATRTAETFMDIYISIVIAAPMIMMLLLILISVSRISIGLSIQALTAIILGVVALINIVFLAFLQLEQTGY
jgi:flagellar protein FlaJ